MLQNRWSQHGLEGKENTLHLIIRIPAVVDRGTGLCMMKWKYRLTVAIFARVPLFAEAVVTTP